jgi:hypothetical protein
MSAPGFLKLAALAFGSALLASACASSGPTMPVECGSGTVTCATDAICCPGSDAFYCGGPIDPDNLGCYPTLKAAEAVCRTEPVNGKNVNSAYACH